MHSCCPECGALLSTDLSGAFWVEWRVAGVSRGISRVQSGAPVTAFTGQNTALDGNICSGSALHPDIIGVPERDHSSRADMVSNFLIAARSFCPDWTVTGPQAAEFSPVQHW